MIQRQGHVFRVGARFAAQALIFVQAGLGFLQQIFFFSAVALLGKGHKQSAPQGQTFEPIVTLPFGLMRQIHSIPQQQVAFAQQPPAIHVIRGIKLFPQN